MADKNLRLTRRKVLGALGAAGAGAALGGAGTMAFFSDEEEFEGNQLVAGSLDLVVDWEEHYSDWRGEETNIDSVRMVRSAGEVQDGEVGLPDPEDPLIALAQDDLDAFMDATALEAYPDNDNDGIQDNFEEDEDFVECEDLAQLNEDLDPAGLRTQNDDTVISVDEETDEIDWAPLVNLQDVKPGDFGELTLSFHLCDNPGYVWLTGGLVEAAENGVTEPEGEDEDEEGPEDEVTSDIDNDVELLDEVQTLLWYDENGDNVLQPGTRADPVDIVLVLDRSGSIGGDLDELQTAANDLVDELTLDATNGAQVGIVSFASDVTLDQGLTATESDIESAINGLSSGGSTNLESAVDAAHEELLDDDSLTGEISPSGGARPGADKIMVVLTDGEPNVDGDGVDEGDPVWGPDDPKDNADAAKSAGIELFTIGFNVGGDTETLLENMASDPTDEHAFIGGTGELENIFGQISQILAGEEAFFRGTLRDLLETLESTGPNNVAGIPLDGNRATEYEEVVSGEPNDGTDPNRDCFVDSTNNYIGFAWWLPADHGNEIQTDSVTFDLGFYTEQCRHNDGLGIPTGNASGNNPE